MRWGTRVEALRPKFSPLGREVEREAHQLLGLAIVASAFQDLAESAPLPRASAQSFLAGGFWLSFWTDVAGLDVEAVRSRARLVSGSPPVNAG